MTLQEGLAARADFQLPDVSGRSQRTEQGILRARRGANVGAGGPLRESEARAAPPEPLDSGRDSEAEDRTLLCLFN